MMVEVCENTPILIRTETFEREEVTLPDEFFVDQDLARERFLLKKPACFIVIGKTACGKTTLAKKIASEWKCKYINPLNLFQNYMDENAPLGKFLQNQLISGNEVSGETALAILRGAIESPEAHHYGYVLDGLPTYEGMDEIMNMLKSTHLPPDYVIYVTIPDADLRPRLESHRFDPEEGLVYNKFYMEDPPVVPPDPVAKPPPKPLKGGPEDGEAEEIEEEGEPEDEDIGEGDVGLPSHPDFPRLDKKTLERLLVRPEDSPEEIERQFSLYRTTVRQGFKDYMRSFPPSNVISVDGNSSPSDMYLSVMTQLRTLPVRPAVPPHQFFPPTDEEEVPEDVEYEELVQTLATKRMPTEHARWQISPWQSLCPVQLYNGILENGKAQFTVGFLGQIFLLSSYEAFEEFIRNPRPFLIAPQPVIPVRIALVGHITAGASSVARLVSERYNASYIDLDELLHEELTAMRNAFLEKVREETETKTIQTISEQRKRELDEIKTNAYTDDATAALTNTVVNVLAENTLEQMLKARSPQDSPPEDDDTEAPDSAEIPGLLEPVTKDHPEVKKAVRRALSYAEIQPLILDPELYANKITEELAKLEQANMDVPKSKRRPISWVLDGLPPNVVVWEKIVEKSAEVRQALSTRRNTLEASRKAEMEAKKRAEEAMEEDEEGQQEKEPDPILEAARAAAETERNKPMPIDPLPTFVFQLKDGLPDYALLMHRLYLMGYGPLKDVPRLVKHDNLVPAMEPMTDSQAAPTADDTTEAPPDLPASNVTFDPMPAPGPEVDYVLNWIRQFEAEWGKTTEFLGKTTSAYGYPAMFSELDIGGKSYDDLYREISIAIQKPLQRPAKESSQDELDEKADAEAEAFAEGGLEDYKPPGEEEGEEEGAEEEEEEAKEEAEEGEEEEEEMQPEEDPSRGPTRQLGRTSYFCPVALKEFQIMKPGDPEVVAEYLGKAYYFGTEEDRAKFLLEPTKYVDRGIQRPIKLPPLRICLVGPTGSGKSLHGRQLATRLNLIHISFPQLMQDIMLAKLHRNVGAQYADDKPIPLRVMPDLEEAVAKALALRENPDAEEAEPDPVGDAEPEELPEVPLNAHEQAIRSHLQDDEELPRESLDLLLKKFWATEPYMSSGIVLEGFPRNGEDVTYMQESNLFPDLCIAFMAEAEDIVSRLLPPRLAKWKIKQARLEANKKIEIEWKKARRLRLYEARKKQIMTELAVKRKAKLDEMRAKAKSPRPKSGDEEEEEQEPEENDDEDNILDEVNVDEMLTEEFPEEEEMEIESEETEAEATERLTDEITEQLETEIANADEVLEALTEIRIPHVTVKAADNITRVRFRLIKRIKSMIVNRQSLFERVYPVKPLEAERLVSSGFKHLSAFGKWCPVTWQDQMACRLPVASVLSPLQHSRVKATALGPLPGTPLVELGVPKKRPTCAAVFREYVFWFQTPADRKKFIDNPLIYLQHKQLPLTHQPLRLAIIGAPKSGKTQLAKRIAKELGIVHLSASAAVNWILKSPSHQRTFLVEKIRDCIRGGNQLYDCLTAGAINVALMTPLAQSRGYVLDGFPVTSEQAERLFDLNVRPILIIDLIARNSSDQVELVSRAIADAEKAMAALSPPVKEGNINEEEEEMEEGEEAKVQTLEQRFGIPPLEVDIIQTQTLKQLALAEADKARKAWFKQHTGLLSEIVCTENRWIIHRKTQELITHRMAHVQEYLWSISRGKAASVAELGITPQEFEKKLSEFGYYCPVRLADDAELFDTADEVTCPQEIRLPVPSDKLDSALSSIIQPCVRHETGEANEEVENIKLCPTVYSEFRFGVEYNGKYYRVAGPRELEKFLANPERYLPPAASRKLPPPEEIPKRLIVDSDLLSRDQFPAQLCLRGYCSVCFQRSGLRYEGLVVGSKEFKAVLNGQLYAFCKRECLMEFLHKPWLYAHLRLPHKLPPAICPLSVRDLPLPGYLEQTVAYALRTALAICAQFRPKFPFISPRRSALIYTALQLKALNPQSPELFRKRAKERVENFEESCRLIEQLAAIMPIRFVNERDRSRELSTRLQRFLALRGKQDTADAWMEPVG